MIDVAAEGHLKDSIGTVLRALWLRWADAICCALLIALPWAVVIWSGNLASTPRFVDDNQIFALDRQMHEHGLVSVVRDHFGDRLLEMKRLVPVYLAHKLFQVRVLGTDLTAWTLYTALIGGLTACALFAFARLMRLTPFEALAFGLIVVLGEQSVLWWRYLHGEGIGLLFAALALVCIPLGMRGAPRDRVFQTLFVLFAVLASLSKESFVLLLPALVFAQLLASWARTGGSVAQALKRHAAAILVLACVCLAELILIRYVLGRTYFHYTGWSGYDPNRFSATAAEFFSIQRSWVLVVPTIAAAFMLIRARRPEGRREAMPAIFIGCGLVVLAVAVLVPQFLLYMSSGFSGQEAVNFSRYLVPSTLALAVLVMVPLHWLRTLQPRTPAVRVASLLCLAAITAYAVLRGATALEAARGFAHAGEDIGVYLHAVAGHVDASDPVLVVAGKHNHHDHTRRVTVLLTEYLGLDNLRYLPVTAGEPLSSFEWRWSETNLYTERIEAATVFDIGNIEPAAILIPFDDHIRLEWFFLLQSADWFDPADYLRFANVRGDVAYFRIGNAPAR